MSAGSVSHIDQLACVACGDCVAICPYGAIEHVTLDDHGATREVARVNPGKCMGCGTCQAICRSKCVELEGYTDEQIFAAIMGL